MFCTVFFLSEHRFLNITRSAKILKRPITALACCIDIHRRVQINIRPVGLTLWRMIRPVQTGENTNQSVIRFEKRIVNVLCLRVDECNRSLNSIKEHLIAALCHKTVY